VKAAGINPLDHYNVAGWKEGRDPSIDFDTNAYLANYTDVKAAQINPLTHFLQSGIEENRSAFADGVFGRPTRLDSREPACETAAWCKTARSTSSPACRAQARR
jgi:hypothetical protein